MRNRRLFVPLSLAVFGLLLVGVSTSTAQDFRASVGGGWGVPTNNVEAEVASEVDIRPLEIDLKPDVHAYAAIGFVRSIGDKFDLGARVRAQASRLRTTIEACSGEVTCTDPGGLQRSITVEGRIILTSPGWIHPYFLVGLGVVNSEVGAVTARGVPAPSPSVIEFQEVSVTDAGGDVGLGASFPLIGGLQADVEFRVNGALPGGKDNAVTVLPMSLGLAYQL